MKSVSDYFYSGDYEDLLDWIIKAYPPSGYRRDGFNAWLKDVKQDFLAKDHHFSTDIADEMRTFWTDNDFGIIGAPAKDERKVKRAQVFNSVRELAVFKIKEVYEVNQDRKANYKDEKSFQGGIRREIRQLVKEGRLEKVSKGVYRLT